MLRQWLRRLLGRQQATQPDLPESLQSALDTLTRRFAEQGIEHALIGGVAVILHGSERGTRDIDFIVDQRRADAADEVMRELGFEQLQRTERFGNYVLGPLRVDLLFTKGEHSQRMLDRAVLLSVRGTERRVARPEDLIGLKLQALANRPERTRDRDDIQLLLSRFAGTMDMEIVREYYVLFGKEQELDAFLEAHRGGGARDARSGG